MKNLLDHREKSTRHAALCVLAAGWMVAVAGAAPMSAQAGPGVRAGVSANPDQFFIGGHYVTEPIWDRMRFQPNLEAGFGDDRTVLAFNLEFAYWMTINADWQVYVGAGPAMTFLGSNGKGGDEVGPGLNVLAGLSRRGRLFVELKVGTFDSPDFKLVVGYTIR